MAYFPDVQAGESFKPNTLLSNNVRHMVNAMDGTKNSVQKGVRSTSVIVQVFCDSRIRAGTAVNFTSDRMCGDAICVQAYSDPTEEWGVVTQDLDAGVAGDCVLAGPVEVELIGEEGHYVKPNPDDPHQFMRGAEGAPILFKKGGKSVIHLGPTAPEYYNGPFRITYDPNLKKIVVSAGYACKAGKFVPVDEKELDPEDGTICVVWGSQPEIKFEKPSVLNYPIGVCEIIDNGSYEVILISCCRVSVALFDGDGYNGPFYAYFNDDLQKIVIGDGYASRNGEFVHVDGTELAARDGTICVVCKLSGGEWTTPVIQYATPGVGAFPIATCDVYTSESGKIIQVNCCRVSVAVFIVTAECPIAAKEEASESGGISE